MDEALIVRPSEARYELVWVIGSQAIRSDDPAWNFPTEAQARAAGAERGLEVAGIYDADGYPVPLSEA